MLYYIAGLVLRFVLFFTFRLKVNGKENMLPEGGVIIAANHSSNWDPILISVTSKRRLAFVAKSELFKNKLFGFFLKKLGAFPVHRGKGDISAVKTALTILKQEKVMIMFPEGTRVKKGEKAEIKPGVAMIASRAKVPVIPVKISGNYRWMSKMTVTYGEPIYLDEYYGEKLPIEKLQELSNSIMDKVYHAEEQV